MSRIVQFNAQNWENIYSYSAQAQILSENSYVPIPAISIPIFLESDIIAIYVNTNVPNGKNWRYGGYIEQRFNSGLLVGGSADSAGEPRNVWINKITTILFPPITANYSLKYYPPRWFKNVEFTTWQYTGVDDDTTEKLITEEFANINFKLDGIDAKL